MFKILLLASVVACAESSSYNVAYECAEGTTANVASNGLTPSASVCCQFVASCANGGTEGGGAIACPSNKKPASSSASAATFTVDTCCESFIPTCRAASYPATGEVVQFECAAGTVLNATVLQGRPTNASQSACCNTFTPDCGHLTTAATVIVGGNAYDIFDCPAGKILNTQQLSNTTVDALTCCKDFNATCAHYTGSILAPASFVCPAGQVGKPAGSAAPNASTCCEAYTASCVQINDANDVFECATGTVVNETASGMAPTQGACCSNTTCLHARQTTCADYANEPQCPVPTDVYDPSKSELVVSDHNYRGKCCMTPPSFSAASSLSAGLAAAGLLLVVL